MHRNITALWSIVYNNTRWSGKCYLLRQFCRIYDPLRTVAKSEGSPVTINLISTFKTEVSRFAIQLAEIDSVAKYLQTENLMVADFEPHFTLSKMLCNGRKMTRTLNCTRASSHSKVA